MQDEFSRAGLLLGADAVDTLFQKHVAVFGIGGVGSYACEALARAGIGGITLIDNDTVSVTNRNRQLIALSSTVGEPKAQVMARRILDINPAARVHPMQTFISADNCPDLSAFDYIIDAIDTVSAKLFLAEQATRLQVPLISCMGTGNKLDPTRFEVADIYKTSVCPLARVMRQELKKRHIAKLKVVYSKEEPLTPCGKLPEGDHKGTAGRPVPGSVSFVPPVAGMILAGEVIRDLINGAS